MADSPPKAAPPPRAAAGNTGPPRPKPDPKPRASAAGARKKATTRELVSKMENQLTAVGMMVGTLDPVGGFILIANAESVSQSWGEVAEVNPAVRRVLENMFSASVYANAGAASLAILLPLLTHYKILPRAWFNPAAGQVVMLEHVTTRSEENPEPQSLADLLIAHGMGDKLKTWEDDS